MLLMLAESHTITSRSQKASFLMGTISSINNPSQKSTAELGPRRRAQDSEIVAGVRDAPEVNDQPRQSDEVHDVRDAVPSPEGLRGHGAFSFGEGQHLIL